jgi:hypothetical protein
MGVRELGIRPTTIISSNGANPIVVNIVITIVNQLTKFGQVSKLKYLIMSTFFLVFQLLQENLNMMHQFFKHVNTQAQCFLR